MASNYNTSKIRRSNKELDAYIGNRIKLRRSELGMSQDKLGAHLGVTFQQVQKYEKGANRVSASVLYNIANALNVDFSYFTNGFEEDKVLHDDSSLIYEIDISRRRESVDLLNVYYKIKNPEMRKTVLKFVRGFSSSLKKNMAVLREHSGDS